MITGDYLFTVVGNLVCFTQKDKNKEDLSKDVNSLVNFFIHNSRTSLFISVQSYVSKWVNFYVGGFCLIKW